MTRVVLLTSDELRHRYLRTVLAADPRLDVARTLCERPEVGLAALLDGREDVEDVERAHLDGRTTTEREMFGPHLADAEDRSRPESVRRGAVNDDHVVAQLAELEPDVVATFGCSLLHASTIAAIGVPIVNLHLGLSPYYRGSGTNLWPLVNGEPELVGATFMYLDEGVDTGEIIHQLRARVEPGDSPHRIGCRVIADAAALWPELLHRLPELGHDAPGPVSTDGREYRRADVDAAVVRRLNEQFEGGLVQRYLEEAAARRARTPIVRHPLLSSRGSA